MKFLISIFISFFLILLTPRAFSQTSLILSQENPSVTISLDSNPSTGFIWLLENYDAHLLKLVKHEYIPAKLEKGMGAAGVEKWVFVLNTKLIAPQLTHIVLIHARPWDVEKSRLDEKVFNVVIN